MKKFTLFAFTLLALVSPLLAGAEFEIKKVDVNLINSPEYQVTPPIHQARAEKWVEAEVTFSAKPEFTDELTLNYYILVGKRLVVGHITHVAIQGGPTKGRELRSVAYISPKALAQLVSGKSATASDIVNVSVTITKAGISAPVSVGSWHPANGEWWGTMKQEEGFVLNKSETPYAPLFWDRYEALKSAASH